MLSPPQHRLPARATPTPSSRSATDDEQLVLPAALPRRRAHLQRLPAAAHRRHRQLRREPRDGAGEHARGRADRVLRGAAHLGEVLFRRRDPHEGGDLDRPHSPTAGRSASACKVAERRARRAAGRRRRCGCVHAIADFLVLDNIKRADRHAPRALRRHRRGADLARPDQVVPARSASTCARSTARPRTAALATAMPDRIKLGTVGVTAPRHRGQDLARGRDPAAGPARLHGLPATSRRRRRRRCATAGCTPATSASSTTRAIVTHHRPHEGHHHHRGRQEHHAVARSRTSSSSRPTSPTRW